MSVWHHEGVLKGPGKRPQAAVKEGYREATGKDGAWQISGVCKGEILWTRWLKRAPKKKAAGAPGLPEWIRRRRIRPGLERSEVVATVVRCIALITERQVNVDRCQGDALELLKVWRSIGHPPLKEFTEETALMARAARECPDELFSQDIRSEGRDGKDRSHSVATLCVVKKWNERLTAARAWQEKLGEARTGDSVTNDDAEDEPPPRQEWT